MSRIDTWMPTHIAAYIADTMDLTTIEHGAYFLLLMHYWRHGPLPDDDKVLASITKVERRVWNRSIGPRMRRFFTLHEDGKLHQKRQDQEREKAIALSGKRRAAVLSGKRFKTDAGYDGDQEAGSAENIEITKACAGGDDINEPSIDGTIDEPVVDRLMSVCSQVCDAGDEPLLPSLSRDLLPCTPSLREGSKEEISLPSEARPKAPRAAGQKSADLEAFEAWWVEYPRKVGKDKALKAYEAARKRGASHVDLLIGLRRQDWDPDPQFVPYPASWLNAGRWKDEASQKPLTLDERLAAAAGLAEDPDNQGSFLDVKYEEIF